MKTIIAALFLLTLALQGYSQYPNITISSGNDPEEPSILINPRSPNILVAGANIRAYYYSIDSGYTWHEGTLNSSYGVWGDPCILIDTAGAFYYIHLSVPPNGYWLDRMVCQKSTDNGQTWDNGSFMGLNPPKEQDKEWAVIDPANNYIYTCWTQFDHYNSASPADSSVILFSRSADGGATWSQTKRINKVAGDCLDKSNTVEGAVPAVGPGGEVYVSWAGPAGLVFTKSIDHGLTWPSENILVNSMPGGWDFAVPGIYRANGMPVTCCDLSNGPNRGTIYINWSDQRNGLTDTDVFFTKSTDNGQTWSNPKRVNDDPPGKQQFFSWMTVDQATGSIYIVFYDRRNYQDTRTDVYLASSHDGGETFRNFRISESPFVPNATVFFGDYTAISAWNNMVRPAWARLDNFNLSVITAIIDSANVVHTPELEPSLPVALDQNYPNPAGSFTYMSFKLHRPSVVSLNIYDLYGNRVVTLIDNKHLQAGKYVEGLDLAGKRLNAGVYYYRLSTEEKTLSKKMIIR